MPIIKKIHISEKKYDVFTWEITESIQDLCEDLKLSNHDLINFNKIKLDSKKKEFIVIRKLLRTIGLNDRSLRYSSKGKPYLINGPMISVSHANNYVVIATSYIFNIGVDIELEKKKILKGEKYFTNIDVSSKLKCNKGIIKKLTKIWCAKEAVFKVVKTNCVNFKNDILIQDFDENAKETIAFFKENKFNIHFYFFNYFHIAVAKIHTNQR